MRFVKVEENKIPKGFRGLLKIEGELTEFMAMNVKCARVQFTDLEYKSANGCYSSLSKAIKRHAFPIKAFTREGKVYLIRTDMD